MAQRKGIIHCSSLLVHMHFIQRKQFNITNVTSQVFKKFQS